MGCRVLGVDGCKAGWVGVVLSDCAALACFASAIGDLAEQASAAEPLDVVTVDMPIGLPDAGRRRADVLARQLAGPRRASVFMTPVRAALAEEDFPAATAMNARLAGEGISRQAHGLRSRILQVGEWVRHAPHRVAGIHPEVSSACLAGAPLNLSTSTWAGAVRRRQLLAGAGIVLADDLGLAGEKAGVDDILDAAVAAWTALRIASGPGRPGPTRVVQRWPAMRHLDVSHATSSRHYAGDQKSDHYPSGA
jgi:predicted RNase H-like nuclease